MQEYDNPNSERRRLVGLYFSVEREMVEVYRKAGMEVRFPFMGGGGNLAWTIARNGIIDRLAELGLHLIRCARSQCKARALVVVPEQILWEQYLFSDPLSVQVGQEYLPEGWEEAGCACCNQFCPSCVELLGPRVKDPWGLLENEE